MKLTPLHYWLIIAGLVISNIIWIYTAHKSIKQRDESYIFIRDQRDTINGLYEVLEYKDSLLNKN